LLNGLAFALLGASGPLGVVEFWSSRPHEMDDDLQAVLLSIGRQLGMFLERVEAQAELRRTLDVLQTSLLPTALPSIPGVSLAAHYQPAGGGVAVGGDFFDVFPLRERRWACVIGDVCGKGAGAAAVTAMARYTIRTAALEHDDPCAVLRVLNTAMRDDETERPFLTACLVVLEPSPDGHAVATIAAAGHPLPLRRTACGEVIQVGREGDLLGVLPDPTFEPVTIELAPGDVLLLYTDGFTEARDFSGRQLGEAGLSRLLRETSSSDPDGVLDALVATLARHTDARHTTDDAAALAIGVDTAR
jgi:sigma-B regulation protein RsbU (phosphoserine phosphatase)